MSPSSRLCFSETVTSLPLRADQEISEVDKLSNLNSKL